MEKRPFAISNILVTTSTRFTVSLCNTIHDALTLLSFNPPIAFHSIHQEFFAWKHLPHFILFYCVQWTMPNNWFMFYSHSLWNWLFCACTKSPRNICTHTQAIACADMDDYNKHLKAQKKPIQWSHLICLFHHWNSALPIRGTILFFYRCCLIRFGK